MSAPLIRSKVAKVVYQISLKDWFCHHFIYIWFLLAKLIKKNKLTTLLQQIYSKKKQASQTYHNYFLLFFICQTHIPVRLFQFFKKYEYFCKRFTGGIFNYKQDESTNIIKRDGKKKGCFISRFPYFPANHGRIWISGTDLWHFSPLSASPGL